MNEATRKRAVEVMADALRKMQDGTAYTTWPEEADAALDGLLAAGFHVAEWRDVAEADKDGSGKIVCDPRDRHSVQSGYFDTSQDKWWMDASEFYWKGDNPPKIMDLPEPPKTDQSRGG